MPDTLKVHENECVGMAANMIGVRKNIIAVNIGFVNKAKSTEKIDGIVALIMALDRCIRNQNAKKDSIYDTRGLIVF